MSSLIRDFTSALKTYELWSFLAWQDIRLRYRLAKIGPFWITLSMAIFCLVLGVVYSKLFKMDASKYMPFLSVGFVVWALIASVLSEFPSIYVDNAAYLKDIRINPLVILLRTVTRNILIFAHNIIIIFGVYLIFGINPGFVAFLALPGLFLLLLNLIACGITLSIIGARFRDVAQIVQSVVQILFFVSPVTWLPHLVDESSWIVSINPIAHYLDLIRSPLLGQFPSIESWFVSFATLLIMGCVAGAVYQRKNSRIPFWV